jgi:energy-coupling factor transport system substrate-specific component
VTREIFRYLVCGIAAALVALGVRVLFSRVMPFGAATLCAQFVSMVVGYWLYRSFVWTSSTRSVRETIAPFVAVNLTSVVVVLAVSIAVRILLIKLFGITELGDLFAHATGIFCGAGLSLIGHRTFTFR